MIVDDPFGAAQDPELPSLRLALDPAHVKRRFKHRLPRLAGDDGVVRVRGIRVTRHKPGRRCVLEYDVRAERPDRPRERLRLIGKVRSGRFGKSGYDLLESLWRSGFASTSADGVSVPEPIGTLPDFRMWLQRKARGVLATDLLVAEGPELGIRIAEAAHKVHEAGVPASSRHTIGDELRILRGCLLTVAHEKKRWAPRIERLLAACERVGAALPPPVLSPIHRDFYADQVLVDGDRLYLIDFDLYCEGDPALDIGNFLAHVTEQSLRELGDPGALEPVEEALEERFVELSGERTRGSVRVHAALTLARHVYLSTRFPDRRSFTEALLDVTEERVGALVRTPVYT